MTSITANAAEILNVGSFNLRCPCDKAPNDWQNRGIRAIRDIESIGFDIFGTQETVPGYVHDITSALALASIGHGRDADKSGESVTIIYNPARLEAISEETFWLSETPEKFSLSWGTVCPRIGTAGIFKDRKTGKKFIFANVHLQHMNMFECQRNQLAVMLDRIKTGYDPALPVILTGDFNCSPDAPASKFASETLRDCRSVSETPCRGPRFATYHAYDPALAKDPEGKPIDYIFVSPSVRVAGFETVNNFDSNTLASSDHFPIKAEVILP